MDDYISQGLERVRQLECRNRLKNQQAKKAAEAADLRRQIIVGSIFLEYFPDFKDLQPRSSSEEDEREFAPLRKFLASLVSMQETQSPQKLRPGRMSSPKKTKQIKVPKSPPDFQAHLNLK